MNIAAHGWRARTIGSGHGGGARPLGRAAGCAQGQEPVKKRAVISSWTALLAYVRAAMAHESREQFRVLFLDKKNQLILDEVMNQGTVDHAFVNRLRAVVARTAQAMPDHGEYLNRMLHGKAA
jgi:hypothetical protein